MIVTALVLAPIVVGLGLYALPRSADVPARTIAALVAALAFVATLAGAGAPDVALHWLARPFTAAFHLGFGPISLWIVALLAVVTFSAALAIPKGPQARTLAAQLLVLLGAMDGVFLSKDLLLFALFWDLMLLPVFLVLIDGTPHARAAWKYLIYNLVGGLALLLATAAYGVVAGSTDVLAGGPHAVIGPVWGWWIFAGFALAFLIKTPVFPLHTWMPETYAALPPPFAAVVSAVQSKAGLYGFLIIGLPLLAPQMAQARPLMIALGLASLLYGAFAALAANDVKRIVAYSSLSHLGLILVAVFSGSALAYAGALVYIVAHGLFSAALFLTLGAVEQREETRELARLGGLGTRNPRLAGALVLAALAALGLPGLAGFAGEILILTGIFKGGLVWPAIIALLPIVLASAYMLRLFQGIMNGPEVPDLPVRRDLSWMEGIALAPLVAAFVWIGVNPSALTASAASSTLATPPAAITSFVPEAPRVR
jgi:NADH-quinone oxidoreductase subunit M